VLFSRWLDARSRGDEQALAAANEALAHTHTWAVLKEMDAVGAWPRILWEGVDIARGVTTAPAGFSAEKWVRRGFTEGQICGRGRKL
jgi:hypothetical protein